MIKYAVGLDISSKDIHACLSSIDKEQNVKVITSKVITNNVSGYKSLITWIDKSAKDKSIPIVIGMEATGIYHEECAYYLYENKFTTCVILPNLAKKYLQASGMKTKNDKMDSKGLSKMIAERAFRTFEPADAFYYKLRTMTRYQQALQELKTIVSNQRSALKRAASIDKDVLKMMDDHIKIILKKIKQIETKIKDHMKSNKAITEQIKNVLKIKGIGILTLAIIVAETNGFIQFKNSRQLVSYSGYDIVENQSGKHNGKTKISKKGNGHIRRALFMPAFTTVTHKCKPFLDLFNRTLAKHNIKMKSYVAVQKKLLVMVYSIWKKNVPFTESYINDNTREEELVSTSLDSLAQAG